MKLSVIIPVYNEETYLAKYLDRIYSQLLKHGLDFELIISENGSLDNTRQLAADFARTHPKSRVITSQVANYGLAVKSGFLAGHGEYLVLFDLDYFDVDFVSKALEMMPPFEAVVGAKRGKGANDSRNFSRKLVTFSFTLLLKLFFGMKISDTHGIKILSRKAFLPIIKKTKFTKEIFDTEVLIRGEYEGLQIGEIGVTVAENRVSRSSIFIRALRTIKDLINLKVILSSEYGQL